MSDRTLTVRLRAVTDGYNRALEEAARKTEDLASRGGKVSAWGDRAEQTGRKLTAGLTLPIAGAGVAVLAMAGNFEASMREVQALTQSGQADMAMLSEQAKKMGAETQFSASQAADAMGQLVKGGFDAKQTYQALPGVMQLAAAAGLDIASAADIATNVLSTFGLQVSELSRVNDILAQTANSTDTDVMELGEAFKFVGPVARSAGYSVEDVAGILGMFAENGVRGSAAGTELRRSISNLLNPTDKAATLLDKLGVKATGANGQLLPMVDIVRQLHDAGATTADMLTIFGDQTAGMVALVTQGNAPLEKLTDNLRNAQGVAQNLADSKMGGLLGSWEQFKGSIETLAITLGEAGLSSLFTGLAQGASSLTDKIANLPTGVQQVGLAVAGLAAASGPAIWGLGKLANLYRPVAEGLGSIIGKLQGMQVQLALARMGGMSTGQALLSMFGPQAAIVVGLVAIAGAFWLVRKRAEEFAAAHETASDAAEGLAESAGIQLQDLKALRDEQGKGTDSVAAFRDANLGAIATLKELGSLAEQQTYLAEIGYQLVMRGATPEQAFKEIQRLADYVGIELPVDLTVANVGEFKSQVKGVVESAKRAAEAGQGEPDGGGLNKRVMLELDSVRKAASAQWDTGNFARFIELLGTSEKQLGDNTNAVNYLADESMVALGRGFGFSLRHGNDLAGMLQQVASGATLASAEDEKLAKRILETAGAMEGGVNATNLAKAAHDEAAKGNADATKAGGEAAAGATGPTGDLAGSLEEQKRQAEAAEEAFQGYVNSLRGATDPMFAMVDAFDANAQAQRDILKATAERDAAVREKGKGSPEAIEAEQRLQDAHMRSARSAQDLMVAALGMEQAVKNGTMTVDGAKQMLLQWAAQGLITAQTAENLAARFDLAALGGQNVANGTNEANGALQALDGQTANVAITADTSQFDASIRAVGLSIIAISGMVAVWNAQAAISSVANRLAGVKPLPAQTLPGTIPQQSVGPGKFGKRASGGQLLPGGSALVGEFGPELVTLAGHQPAWVSTAEQTRAMFTATGPSSSFTPATPSLNDSRIVDRLDQLQRRLGTPGDNITMTVVAPTPELAASRTARRLRSREFARSGR